MTVDVDTIQTGPYLTNGVTTQFAYAFKPLSADEIEVVRVSDVDGAESVISPALYSVSAVGAAGHVTFTTAPDWDDDTLLVRATPVFTQDIDLENQTDFDATTIMEEMDRGAQRDIKLNMMAGLALAVLGLALGDANLDTSDARAKAAAVFRGDPGGNAMAVGAWTGFAGLTIPTGTDLVQTSGYATTGIGAARYALDSDQATVTVSETRRKSANGRWFRLAENFVTPHMFGAKGDNTQDDTSAIQAAVDYRPSGGYTTNVFCPAGKYKVVGGVIVSLDRVHLWGAGPYATLWNYAPTANGTCLLVSAGAAIINQGSIKDIAFRSDDATYKKVAVKISDSSGYVVDNIVVSGSVVNGGAEYWSGGAGGSVGIQTCGREAASYNRLYVYADRPLQISDNPNHSIDIDHHNFHNCYFSANGYPNVTIDSGVNLSHVTFDGYQSWVGGTYGLYWVDAATSQASIMLSLENVRWEQAEAGSGWFVRIEHNANLYQLSIRDCYYGNPINPINGIKLRRCVGGVRLANVYYLNTLVGVDADSTVDHLSLDNVVNNEATATFNISATRVDGTLWRGPNGVHYSGSAPGAGGITYSQAWNANASNVSQLEALSFTVPASTIQKLGSSLMQGSLFITADADVVGHYMLKGPTGAAAVKSQSDAGWFGDAAGAANYNIYYSGGEYKIQNNTGSPQTFWAWGVGIADRG